MDFSEHVYDGEWLNILTSINMSLKTDGKFYMHTPNANFILEIMKNHNFILKQFPQHIAVRTPEQNIQLLEKSGFKINQLSLIPHYNGMVKWVHIFSYIPVMGKYLKARIFIEAQRQQ